MSAKLLRCDGGQQGHDSQECIRFACPHAIFFYYAHSLVGGLHNGKGLEQHFDLALVILEVTRPVGGLLEARDRGFPTATQKVGVMAHVQAQRRAGIVEDPAQI